MPTEIWTAIVGVVGTLIGVCFGACLSKRTALDLVVRQAKAEFSAAFTETLVQLHSPNKEQDFGKAHDILKDNFPVHLAAYLKLKSALPSRYSQPLEKAWNRYTKDGEHESKEEKETYRFAYVLNGKNNEEMQTIAIEHVNAFIKDVQEA